MNRKLNKTTFLTRIKRQD